MLRGAWGVLLVMGLYSGCGWARPEAAEPLPRPWRGPALPVPATLPATFSETPKPYETFSFTTEHAIAAYFTRSPWQVLLFPQLGQVFGITDPYPNVLLFDDGKDILMYDLSAEEKIHLFDGRDLGGFAFNPDLEGKDNLYFLATSDPHLAADRRGFAYVLHAAPAASPQPSATPGPTPGPSVAPEASRDYYHLRAYRGVPFALSKLNAFALQHGALRSIKATKPGDFLVVTTGDGALASYEPPTDELRLLLPNKAFFEGGKGAADAWIQPIFERYVLWVDQSREGLYLLDRWNGTVEPVPFGEGPARPEVVSDLGFMDAYRINFIATFPGDPPRQRLVSYDLVRRTFEALVEFNLDREAL